MDLGIKGKRALVLASSKGLGHGIAVALAREGANVLLCGRSSDRLAANCADINAEGNGKADWVISNDSGPMHLAAAMGLKTIGLFGPTDPRQYGPYPLKSPTNYAIQAPVGDLNLLSAKEVFFLFNRIEASLHKAQAKAALAHA